MKKLFCMIALAAIASGSVFAAVPARHVNSMQTDTMMKKKKMKKKMKNDTMKMKMKKDTMKMN